MGLTEEQRRNLIIEQSFKRRQPLRDTIERNIGELYDLRPSDAHAYLYALDHIFAKYGENQEEMSKDGLIMIVSVNRR